MDKRLTKNYIYNLAYQILNIILPIITTPYVSRILGAGNIGIYSYTSSIVSYFALFINFGFNTFGQKEVASNQKDEAYRSQLFFEIQIKKILFLLLTVIVYLAFIYDKQYYKYYVIQIITLVATYFDISYFYQGMEQYKITVIRNALIKILGLVLIFLLVNDKNDLLIYIGIQCISTFLGNITLWLHLKKYVNPKYFHKFKFGHDFKVIAELFIPVISVQLYFTIDKTMLGLMLDTTEEVGYYEQALKVVRVGQTIITSLGAVMISSVTRMMKESNKKDIRKTIAKAIEYETFIASPMMFGIIAVSESMVPWFFGPGYDRVAILMSILSPIILLSALSNIAGNGVLIPTGRHNYLTLSTACAAGANIILNYILIQKYYAAGAAIASVISEIIVLVIEYIFSFDYLDLLDIVKKLVKYLIAGATMFVALKCIDLLLININIPTFFESITLIVCGVLIYFIILYIIKDEFILAVLRKMSQYLHKKK